jgi:hypothetical protein
MPSTNISCDICGAESSKSGKPFDGRSLLQHKSKVHGAKAAGQEPLSCDICGATHSYRGVPFLTSGHLRQHRNKQHPSETMPSESAVSKNGRKPKTGSTAAGNGGHHVKFCPQCGCNLEVVHAAIDFANGGGII